MEEATFKRDFEAAVDALEEFQHTAQTAVITLLNPAHVDQDGLPSFVKRLKHTHIQRKQGGRRTTATDRKEHVPSAAAGFRLTQWNRGMGELRAKLHSLRARIDALPVQPIRSRAPPSSSSPPNLNALRQLAADNEDRNKVVSTRLASAVSALEALLDTRRTTVLDELAHAEAAVNTMQTLADTVLKQFHTNVEQMCIVLRDFYDRQINSELRKFEQHCDRTRQHALGQQRELYQAMYNHVNQQHATFERMMRLLADEIQGVVHHPDTRVHLETRLRNLQRRTQSMFVEAQIYYQEAPDCFVFQPLSPVFYREVRRWLVDFQLLFFDLLHQAQNQYDSGAGTQQQQQQQPAPVSPRNGGGSGSGGSTVRNFLRRLYQNQHQQQQSSLSSSGSGPPAGLRPLDLLRQQNLLHPSPESVGELFAEFVAFKHDTTNARLERLKQQIAHVEDSWKQLSEQVVRAHHVQQGVHSQQVTTDVEGHAAPPPPHLASPEVTRLLLQLEGELKTLEASLEDTYTHLHQHLQPERVLTEQQQRCAADILEQLFRWQTINRDWEALITQEQVFLQAHKSTARANNRHVAMQFIGWNYFCTEQLDELETTTALFTTNIFHRHRAVFARYLTDALKRQAERKDASELQLAMLGTLFDGIRREDIGAADAMVRMQTQVTDWVEYERQRQAHDDQVRFKQALQYHVAGLDAALNSLSGTPMDADEDGMVDIQRQAGVTMRHHPVLLFLQTIDAMYAMSVRCETAGGQTPLAKERQLLHKLGLDPFGESS